VILYAIESGVCFMGLRPHALRVAAINNVPEHGIDLSETQEGAGQAVPETRTIYDTRYSGAEEISSFEVEY
jgi:hypothetical protein